MQDVVWNEFEIFCKVCKQEAIPQIYYEVHSSGSVEMIIETECSNGACPITKETRYY